MRALSAVAGAGITALFAAVAAAVTAALAEVGDKIKKTKEDLTDIGLGPKAAAEAKARAEKLGVPFEEYGKGISAIQKTQQLYGGAGAVRPVPGKEEFAPGAANIKAQQTAYETLINLGKLHLEAPADAAKSATEFFESFKKQAIEHPERAPTVTREQVTALPEGVQNDLAKALGRGATGADLIKQLDQGLQITNVEVLRALDRIAGATEKQVAQRPPEKETLGGIGQEIYEQTKGKLPAEDTNNFLIRALQNAAGKPEGAPRSLPEALKIGAASGAAIGAPLGLSLAASAPSASVQGPERWSAVAPAPSSARVSKAIAI